MASDYLTDEERAILVDLGDLRSRLLRVCARGRGREDGSLDDATMHCPDAVEACNHITALYRMVALNSVVREHGAHVAVLMGRRSL